MRVEALRLFTSDTARHQIVLTRKLSFETQVIIGTVSIQMPTVCQKEQVKELEKHSIAHFYGFQSDPRPFYIEADCIVLPSYHEGMSNVILEAAATGRPVITSNIPGCRESVENGKSGLLVEVKNKEMLYDAMKEMLHCSREEREQMGQAGREKMEREFRKEVVVEKTVQSLREDEKRDF